MLTLSNSYINKIVELEDANTLQVTEEVPFTILDLVNGFNAPLGTNVDANADAYPKVEDLVLLLYAFGKPYEPLAIETIELAVTAISNVGGSRTLSDTDYSAAEFAYSDIAYKWNIDITAYQGVVEFYMVALLKDDSNQQFYYNTAEGTVMEVRGGEIEPVLVNYDFVKAITNKAFKKCLHIPQLSQTFSDLNKKQLFLLKDECKNEKLLKKLIHIENLIRIGANVANGQAGVGAYTIAQETIEMLQQLIKENERLWK
jgi:hypothetical protein